MATGAQFLLDRIAAKEAADKQKAQLKGIDIAKITDPELREALSKADALVARSKKTVPQSLEITKNAAIAQALAESDIEIFFYKA